MARGNEKKKSKKKPLIVVDLDDDEEKTFPIEEEEAVYEVERVVDCRYVICVLSIYFLLFDEQNCYNYFLECTNLVAWFSFS